MQIGKNFFQKHLGKGRGDYDSAPNMLDELTQEAPTFTAGVGLGAGVGAIAGYLKGAHSLAADQVSIATQRTEFLKPQLVGARYIPEDCTTHFTYDDKGAISGSYQTCDSPYFRPLVAEHRTGLIEERKVFEHTHSLTPLKGMAYGLAGGAILGGVLGVLASQLKDVQLESDHRGSKDMLVGAGIGTVVGGAAGYAASALTTSKAQHLEQVIQTPVTVSQQIGWVPRAHAYWGMRGEMNGRELAYTDTQRFSGQVAVVREVPTGEYRTHTLTSQSHSLSPLQGTLLGAGMGLVAGGLLGAAVGVLQNTLSRD